MTTCKVHSLESFGAADGPGVRYVIFLQGCRMRCQFCHNPDTWEEQGGTIYTAEELLSKALRYRNYWGTEGGVTVSGGEPLLQMDFLLEFFALAKEKGIANGEKVRISSARGTVDAVAMVTVRLTPFKCGGKTVHQVGMTFNYGWLQPKECGDTANLLSPMVGDANSMTPEYKAFMVNIDKIKA